MTPNLRAYLYLTTATLCFGMNANLSRLAVGEISPLLIVALRWLGVVILLSLFVRKNFIKDWPTLKPQWPLLITMGVLGFTAFNALFYIAAHTTTALNLGIIQGAIPVFVLIGTVLVYKATVRSLQLVGILVTILGVIIVASGGDLNRLIALHINQGDFLMIIACVLYAGYSIALRRCPNANPLSLFSLFALGALLAAIPLTFVEAMLGQLQWPTPKGWLIIGLITVFPSFLAQWAIIKGIALIGAGRAGIFFNLIPIFAALIAVLFLGEVFTLYHGTALVLILGGIAISEWGKQPEP